MTKAKRRLDFVRDEAGAAIIEFALVAPLLLTLVWGIIETGRAFYTLNSLASAVRDGARYGAACNLGSPGLSLVIGGTTCDTEIRNLVVAAFQPLGPALTIADVTPSVVGGNRIRVEAAYAYQPITPIAGWQITIRRAAVFRYERLP
jgi:Flp pilus assembly protein TadG